MRVCNNKSKQGHFWTLNVSQRTHQSVSVSVKLEGNQVSSWCPTELPAKSNYKSVPRFSGNAGGGLDSIWCWVEQLLGFSLDWNWDWLAFFSEREPAGGLNQAAPSHGSHSSHWPHAAPLLCDLSPHLIQTGTYWSSSGNLGSRNTLTTVIH